MIDLFIIQLFLVISIVIFLIAIGFILLVKPIRKSKKLKTIIRKKYNEGV